MRYKKRKHEMKFATHYSDIRINLYAHAMHPVIKTQITRNT